MGRTRWDNYSTGFIGETSSGGREEVNENLITPSPLRKKGNINRRTLYFFPHQNPSSEIGDNQSLKYAYLR